MPAASHLDGQIPAAIKVLGPGWPSERERTDRVRPIHDDQILELKRRTRACRHHFLKRVLTWRVVPSQLLALPQAGQRIEDDGAAAA
jgi:hypothetical protein